MDYKNIRICSYRRIGYEHKKRSEKVLFHTVNEKNKRAIKVP